MEQENVNRVQADFGKLAALRGANGRQRGERNGIKEAATRELIAFVPPPAPARAA